MKITAAYTDLYQLTMAQVYFKTKPDGRAVFDYYYRHNPFNGGYSIFAGLEDVLNVLENFKFSTSDIEYLKQHGFENDFLEYLNNFSFKGTIFSSKEGEGTIFSLSFKLGNKHFKKSQFVIAPANEQKTIATNPRSLLY